MGKGDKQETVPKFNFKPGKAQKAPSSSHSPPLPVSPTFDGLRGKEQTAKYDRSYWEVEVLRRHPEIRGIIERVDPVSRAAAFSELYMPNRRLHPQEGILALISQHLKLLGLTRTSAALDDAWAFPIESPAHFPVSQLVHHLEKGVVNAEKCWSLLLPTPTYPTAEAAIKKNLDAHVNAVLSRISEKDEGKDMDDDEGDGSLRGIVVDEDTMMPKTGTINQLVWAAATGWGNFHNDFVPTFAMTYLGFMTSSQMFEKLKEVWNRIKPNAPPVIPADTEDGGDADTSMDISRDTGREPSGDAVELTFVRLYEKWMEQAFFDFDLGLIDEIAAWIDKIETNKPAAKKRMRDALQKQLNGKVSDKHMDLRLDDVNIQLPLAVFTSQFSLLDMFSWSHKKGTMELARQITMATAKYYYQITAKELLDCAWSKPSMRHRSPNIIALTNKFNILSDWVVSEILNAPTKHFRIKRIIDFAKLADALWNMSNFFDAMAIASSINGNAIYRLKHHKAIIEREFADSLKPIEVILEASKSDKNFANLLQIHNDALAKGHPAIPYVGVYLTQLTFTYDGNPDFIEGKVNFSKCVGVYKIIDKILKFQTKQYNFLVIDQVQEKLRELKREDESKLFSKSLKVEDSKLSREKFLEEYERENFTPAAKSVEVKGSPLSETS